MFSSHVLACCYHCTWHSQDSSTPSCVRFHHTNTYVHNFTCYACGENGHSSKCLTGQSRLGQEELHLSQQETQGGNVRTIKANTWKDDEHREDSTVVGAGRKACRGHWAASIYQTSKKIKCFQKSIECNCRRLFLINVQEYWLCFSNALIMHQGNRGLMFSLLSQTQSLPECGKRKLLLNWFRLEKTLK